MLILLKYCTQQNLNHNKHRFFSQIAWVHNQLMLLFNKFQHQIKLLTRFKYAINYV